MRALSDVDGVVKLVDVGSTPDGKRWLVMQPVGSLIDLEAPAAVKIGALKQLATIIGRLASIDWMHSDVSHFNVLRKDPYHSDMASLGPELDIFLTDFGTACSLKLVQPATLNVIPVTLWLAAS